MEVNIKAYRVIHFSIYLKKLVININILKAFRALDGVINYFPFLRPSTRLPPGGQYKRRPSRRITGGGVMLGR